MKFIMTASLLTTAALAADPAPLPAPPASPARPVTDTLHGVAIADPYRWLEGDEKGKSTGEVAAWTAAQNARTRAILDALPGRKALEDRLRPLMQLPEYGLPSVRGNLFFHTLREGAQNQPVLYVREGVDGADRPLFDPNAFDPTGLTAVEWWSPSRDGARVAIGVFRSGDENTMLMVLETATGNWLADEIHNHVRNPAWLPDGSGFVYRRLSDPNNPYSGEIRYHRIGTHWRMDRLLFSQYTERENKALANTYGPYHDLSRDGRWLVLYYYTGTRSNDIAVLDFAAWLKEPSGTPVFRPVLSGTLDSGASGSGPVRGDTLYLLTTVGAPTGRVVAVDLKTPDPAHWRELLPARKDCALQDLQLAKGGLIVTSLVNASTRIERLPEAGGAPVAVTLPGLGTATVSAEPERDEFFFDFESYNRPHTLYRLDPARGPATVWMKTAVPVDPDSVEVEQVWYPSMDGTKISMFLVHKKGLQRDGNNPTLLYGYGGFNVSETPGFIATLFPWFEAGGVYAAPNLRGGGEYGEAWHRGGMLDKKQNVFDDFIAAGEWLVKQKLTNPKRLAISGGSNGGLLTGAALVQRPDLFAAALVGVPLLDMLRYQNFLMAKYWVPEYGSSEDAAQFAYLRRYSPYQNLKDGVRYPAVFLTAGEHDARVHPLHARKMAARLQAIGAAEPNAEPVLLWVDQDAGHGQGKPLDLQLRDVVDKRLFTMWKLGMLERAK